MSACQVNLSASLTLVAATMLAAAALRASHRSSAISGSSLTMGTSARVRLRSPTVAAPTQSTAEGRLASGTCQRTYPRESDPAMLKLCSDAGRHPSQREGKCLDNVYPTPEEMRARFSAPAERNHLKEPKTTGERTLVRARHTSRERRAAIPIRQDQPYVTTSLARTTTSTC